MLNQLPVDLFECLDNHAVKLEELDILASSLTQMETLFINSTQFTFIKTLTLWGARIYQDYDILSTMPALKDLTIVFLYDSKPTMAFIKSILQGCPPSLSSLKLDMCLFNYGSFDPISSFDRPNSIQRLVLSNTVFSRDVGPFLSHHLSSIQELVLKNCTFHEGKLNLPEFKLDSLEVHHDSSDGKYCISVITLEDGKNERYTSCCNEAPIKSQYVYGYPDEFSPFPSTKRITDTHDYNANPHQTVSCWSVRKLNVFLSKPTMI